MKNFLRVAVVLAVVLCVAIAMVACAEEAATTTKAPTTTAAPDQGTATTTTAGGDAAVTTTPAATTAPGVTTTPVATTTPADTTASPYYVKMTNLKIDGVERNDVWIFEAKGYWSVNEEGYITNDTVASIAELVGVEFTSGTIETEIVVNGGKSQYDTGFCFAISDPFDAELPYYWEVDASYWFYLASDALGVGLSRCGWDNDGNGTVDGWHWVFTHGPHFADEDGDMIVDGESIVLKVDTDGETYADFYANGELVYNYAIPEGENLFTAHGTTNAKVALRAEGIGTYYKYFHIENVEQ